MRIWLLQNCTQAHRILDAPRTADAEGRTRTKEGNMPRTILVTGASSGIGAAVAHLFHRRGFIVFGTSRSADPAAPHEFPMLKLDVNSDDSVKACVGEVLTRAGRIDVLVNNAGFALSGAAEETSIAEAKEQFETNFFGVVRMVQAVLPAMREARSGRIITIGSLAGLMAIPYNAFYNGTKFALEGYSEALWFELKPFGISVSLIEPGFVRTPINQAARTAANRLSAYDGPRDRAMAVVDRSIEKGIPADFVANIVFRAAQSRTPRLRYRVGADSRWLPRLKKVSPWNLFAAGVRRTFELDAGNQPQRVVDAKSQEAQH
jgi:NAD(P)-dependent dehydrogenase (short-subunit alcohol dehydrogenase family)